MSEALLCYLIHYLGFGLIFFVGLAYCFAQGDVGLRTPRRRRALLFLLGGYGFFASLHGVFQFVTARL